MFARGFYSVVAFLMLFGVVANIIYAALVGQEAMAHAVAASACLSLMLFAAQKLTLHKRRGFWRETACPFLIAVVMTGLGTCIALLATQRLCDQEFAFTIIGIVFSGLLLLVLTAARFWPMLDQLDEFVKENLEGCCPAPQESDFDGCAEPGQGGGDAARPAQGEVRA